MNGSEDRDFPLRLQRRKPCSRTRNRSGDRGLCSSQGRRSLDTQQIRFCRYPSPAARTVLTKFAGLLAIVLLEATAFFRQVNQQSRRRPEIGPVHALKVADTAENMLQADCIGVEHWSTAPNREAIA